MNGTEKQIKWANEIKARIESEIPEMSGAGGNCRNALLSIDNSTFWIENRTVAGMTLMQMFAGEGIRDRGCEFPRLLNTI